MKALIMAAGYATRLYPLTKDRAKPLLPVGGRPIIDYICDALEKVREIDHVYVVTNNRFAPSFETWARERRKNFRMPIDILNDGTVSDEDKLGAIGDIRFAIRRERIADDLFVVLGDNLFDLDLETIIPYFKRKGATVAAYDVGSVGAAKLYGILGVDRDFRVIDFKEKPETPPSTLAAIGMYLFPRDMLDLFRVYEEEGNKMDAPGYYIRWLYRKVPVYAFVFRGVWYDIGDLQMYHKADALYSSHHRK